MPIVETLIVTVGPAIAKTFLKIWFKDSDLATNVSLSLVDLIAMKSKEELSQRRARQQFEEIGIKVAKRLGPIFEREGLAENSQNAVAYAVSDTLNNTPLDARLLISQDLEPSTLATYLLTTDQNRRLIRDLSTAEVSLYNRTIQEISTEVVEIASRLPNFTEQSFAELLKRDSSLLEIADQIHAEVRSFHNEVQQAKRDEEKRKQALEEIYARAIELSIRISPDDQRTITLSVLNRGTHIVRDIEINAIPNDEDWFEHTHGPLPRVQPGAARAEVIYPILGGWFVAKVNQLSPNRGLGILVAQLSQGDYTEIDFDVFWNDHIGQQRKSHAVFDVARDGEIPLEPRKSWHPLMPTDREDASDF